MFSERRVDWYCGFLHHMQLFRCDRMAVGSMVHRTNSEHIPLLEDWGSFWKGLLKPIRQGFGPNRANCPEWERMHVSSTLLLIGKSDHFCGNWSVFESSLVDLCPGENLIFQSIGNHAGQVHTHAEINSKDLQAICQGESIVM